jgi:serine/threonine protein kinase
VALKLVPPHLAANPVLMKRFEQEYTVARHLDHPNIVKALDYGTTGTTPYLVMELVDGEPLGAVLARGRLPLDLGLDYACQVLKALA